MSEPKSPPALKGFGCPECKGHRLFVTDTERPMPGLVVRFRECSACGYRVVTEERVAKARATKRRLTTRKKFTKAAPRPF